MTNVRSAAAQAGNNPLVETGARIGYAASGLLHLLLAWLAVQVAWTSYSGNADQAGALETLTGNPVGSALLWLVLVGFVLLTLWQLTEVVTRGETGDRLKAAGRALIYAALAWTTFGVLRGGGSGGAGESQTTQLMQSSAGRVLVGLIGLVVIGVGIYHVYKGWTKKFLEDLQEHPGTWAVRAGRFGYVAKGVALAVVGGLLTSAAATSDASKAQGLDGALRTLLDVPLGKALLTVIALGFAAYGVYAFARARYARV